MLRNHLLEIGMLSESENDDIQRQVNEEVDEAQRYAEEAPVAKPEDALLYVLGVPAE